MLKIIIVGSGGFIGAVLRYTISGWTHRVLGSGFPYGTLFVNLLGSFVLGFFLFYSEGRSTISPLWRNFMAIGLLGALTTFSTFSYETLILFQQKLYFQASLNIALNVLLTILAVWLGMVLAKIF